MSDTDLVVPVWKVSPRPVCSTEDRTRIAARHWRETEILPEGEDERVAIDARCGFCHERWGDNGCSTRRALAVLAIAEHERDVGVKQAADAVRRLGELAVIGAWHKRPDVLRLEASLIVDSWALAIGGQDMLIHSLHDMAKEILAAHKKGPKVQR